MKIEDLFEEYDVISEQIRNDDIDMSRVEFEEKCKRLEEIEKEVKNQGGGILDAGWYKTFTPPEE